MRTWSTRGGTSIQTGVGQEVVGSRSEVLRMPLDRDLRGQPEPGLFVNRLFGPGPAQRFGGPDADHLTVVPAVGTVTGQPALATRRTSSSRGGPAAVPVLDAGHRGIDLVLHFGSLPLGEHTGFGTVFL